MPLSRGKSDEAFSHNVRTEMEHGKPQKQALAIAYRMRRMARGGMAKKYAEGGQVHETLDYTEMKPGERKGQSRAGVEVREAARQRSYGDADSESRAKRAEGRAKEEHRAVLADQKSMKKPNLYAEGGQIEDNYESPSSANHQTHDEDRFHEEEQASGYEPMPMESAKENHRAEMEDDRDLNQHGEDETGPMGAYAEGGEIDDLDMVGHIMKHRQQCYSEGGKVANDTPITAGFEENDFDDLPKRDNLESSYTGANSGDELGYSNRDDGEDIVSRMMRQRRDRMPNTGMPGYGRGRHVG